MALMQLIVYGAEDVYLNFDAGIEYFEIGGNGLRCKYNIDKNKSIYENQILYICRIFTEINNNKIILDDELMYNYNLYPENLEYIEENDNINVNDINIENKQLNIYKQIII